MKGGVIDPKDSSRAVLSSGREDCVAECGNSYCRRQIIAPRIIADDKLDKEKLRTRRKGQGKGSDAQQDLED